MTLQKACHRNGLKTVAARAKELNNFRLVAAAKFAKKLKSTWGVVLTLVLGLFISLTGCNQQKDEPSPQASNNTAQSDLPSARTSETPETNPIPPTKKEPEPEPKPPVKKPASAVDLVTKATRSAQSGDFGSAVDSMKAACGLEPDNQRYALMLIQLLQSQGGELAQRNRDAGNPMFLESAKMAHELLAQGIADERAKALLATAIYNEACCLSIEGETDRALASLRKALEIGFEEFELVKSDSDLDRIREERKEDFESLYNQFYGAFLEQLVSKTESEIAKFESFDFDFKLTDVEGNSVSKDDFQGKVLIADIWGTWCPPCREEIPLFIQLKDQYADQLEIVGINYERADDSDEATSMVKEFMNKYSMNYNCVIGDEETRQQVPNFEGFPTTLFIDGTGKVRLVLVGLQSFAKLESIVKALANETNSN